MFPPARWLAARGPCTGMSRLTGAAYHPGLHLSRGEYWCYISGMTHAAPSCRARLPLRRRRSGPRPGQHRGLDLARPGGGAALDLRPARPAGRKAPACSARPPGGGSGALAAERPRAAAAALEYAHRTRETLRDLFGAIARGESPGAALPRFNQLLAEAMERLEVAPEAAVAGGPDTAGAGEDRSRIPAPWCGR